MPILTDLTPLVFRSKTAVIDWIDRSFADVETPIFGTLSYPYNPTDAPVTEDRVRNDVSIFLERVFCRVPRSYFSHDPKRIFSIEDSLNAGLDKQVVYDKDGSWGVVNSQKPEKTKKDRQVRLRVVKNA